MKNADTFTIVNTKTCKHYDTNDEKFYSENWDRTFDTEKYLEQLIQNNKEKFEGCSIKNNI